MSKQPTDDADILSYRGFHPAYGKVQYERVRQDRRTYYRLVGPRLPTFGLTDAKHARENLVYWTSKGWIEGGTE